MLMYAYDYVGMGSGPQKLICFALKARYEIMLLISFWTSLGIYILDSHIGGRGMQLLLFVDIVGEWFRNPLKLIT